MNVDLHEVANFIELLQLAASPTASDTDEVKQDATIQALVSMKNLPNVFYILENNEEYDPYNVSLAILVFNRICSTENSFFEIQKISKIDKSTFCFQCYKFMLKYEEYSHIFAKRIITLFPFANVENDAYFKLLHEYLFQMYQTIQCNSTTSKFNRFIKIMSKLSKSYIFISTKSNQDHYYHQYQHLVMHALNEIGNTYFSSKLLIKFRALNCLYDAKIFTIQQPLINFIIGFMINIDKIQLIVDDPYKFLFLESISGFLSSLYIPKLKKITNQAEIVIKKKTTHILLNIIPAFLQTLLQIIPENIIELEDTVKYLLNIIIINMNELIELELLTKTENYFNTLVDICYQFSTIDNDTIIDYDCDIQKYYSSVFETIDQVDSNFSRNASIHLLKKICQMNNHDLTLSIAQKVTSQNNEQSFLIISSIFANMFADDDAFQLIRLYIRDVFKNIEMYEPRVQYTIIHMISHCILALDLGSDSQFIYNIIMNLFMPSILAMRDNLVLTPQNQFEITMGSNIAYRCMSVIDNFPYELFLILVNFANKSFSSTSFEALTLYLNKHEGMMIDIRRTLISMCLNGILNTFQSNYIANEDDGIRSISDKLKFIKYQTINPFPDFVTADIINVFDSILETDLFQDEYPTEVSSICKNLIVSRCPNLDMVLAFVVKGYQTPQLSLYQYDFSIPILAYISLFPQSFRDSGQPIVLLRHILNGFPELIQSIQEINDPSYFLDYSTRFELISRIVQIMGNLLSGDLIEQITSGILWFYDDISQSHPAQNSHYKDVIHYMLFQNIASLFACVSNFYVDEAQLLHKVLPNWMSIIKRGFIKYPFYRILHHEALLKIQNKFNDSDDLSQINFAGQLDQVVHGLKYDTYDHNSKEVKDFFRTFSSFETFNRLHNIPRVK